eukprot:ctg_7122.g669
MAGASPVHCGGRFGDGHAPHRSRRWQPMTHQSPCRSDSE